MGAIKFYTVTRHCCTSGMCFDCHQRGSGPKPARIVHASHVSEELAKQCLKGWARYAPKMEEEQEDR